MSNEAMVRQHLHSIRSKYRRIRTLTDTLEADNDNRMLTALINERGKLLESILNEESAVKGLRATTPVLSIDGECCRDIEQLVLSVVSSDKEICKRIKKDQESIRAKLGGLYKSSRAVRAYIYNIRIRRHPH